MEMCSYIVEKLFRICGFLISLVAQRAVRIFNKHKILKNRPNDINFKQRHFHSKNW